MCTAYNAKVGKERRVENRHAGGGDSDLFKSAAVHEIVRSLQWHRRERVRE